MLCSGTISYCSFSVSHLQDVILSFHQGALKLTWAPLSSFQAQQQKQQHPVRGGQGQQPCVPGQSSISVPFYSSPMVFSQAQPIAVAAQVPTDSSERQPAAEYSQDRSLRYPQPCWHQPGDRGQETAAPGQPGGLGDGIGVPQPE